MSDEKQLLSWLKDEKKVAPSYQCLCILERIDGVLWRRAQPDCRQHGIFEQFDPFWDNRLDVREPAARYLGW